MTAFIRRLIGWLTQPDIERYYQNILEQSDDAAPTYSEAIKEFHDHQTTRMRASTQRGFN